MRSLPSARAACFQVTAPAFPASLILQRISGCWALSTSVPREVIASTFKKEQRENEKEIERRWEGGKRKEREAGGRRRKARNLRGRNRCREAQGWALDGKVWEGVQMSGRRDRAGSRVTAEAKPHTTWGFSVNWCLLKKQSLLIQQSHSWEYIKTKF